MDEQEVARFLEQDPTFFERHAALLNALRLPNPHGGQAIALSERQVQSLREEGRLRLEELTAFAVQERFVYRHPWRTGDVLMWDHIGTWHNAVADYRADEPRLMKRCQVLADRIFDPAFLAHGAY